MYTGPVDDKQRNTVYILLQKSLINVVTDVYKYKNEPHIFSVSPTLGVSVYFFYVNVCTRVPTIYINCTDEKTDCFASVAMCCVFACEYVIPISFIVLLFRIC